MATSAPSLDRPMPHFLEAEKSVLGAILVHSEYFAAVVEKGLKAGDFFDRQHRLIYEAMRLLDDKRNPIDLLTVNEQLRTEDTLEKAGGVAYLAHLVDGRPHVVNIEHWTDIIREKALLRNIIAAAERMQTQALDANESAEEILGSAEASVFELADERVRHGLVGIRQVVNENFERISQIYKEGRRVTGLSTGYSELDNMTSGLQPSELVILAARPSMGKTAFALNLAENIAVRDKKAIAIFSLEMSKESLF